MAPRPAHVWWRGHRYLSDEPRIALKRVGAFDIGGEPYARAADNRDEFAPSHGSSLVRTTSGYTAAEKCDEFPPPHGAYPKAKDYRSSIAGQGRASQQKRPLNVGYGSFATEAVGATTRCMSALPRKRTNTTRPQNVRAIV